MDRAGQNAAILKPRPSGLQVPRIPGFDPQSFLQKTRRSRRTRRQAEIRPEYDTVTRPGSPHESGISRRQTPGSRAGVVTLDRAWGGGCRW